MKLGYRFMETDVHTTSDGQLVVHHDAELDRTTDRTGQIANLTLAEVRRARVGGLDQIPTLDEVLEEFPVSRFLIDIKDARGAAILAQRLFAHSAWGRVCVGSFGRSRLARFRKLAPAGAVTSADPIAVLAHLSLSRPIGPSPAAYQVPLRWQWGRRSILVLTPAFIARAHARGAVVHVWTVNNEADMEQVLDLGVDGIVTDALDVARDVLQRRGLWEES